SKSCGLPQLKLGWIAAFGPQALRSEALRRLELIADSYLSVATPVQRAAKALLARLPELQAPIQARIAANLARRELHAAARRGRLVCRAARAAHRSRRRARAAAARARRRAGSPRLLLRFP